MSIEEIRAKQIAQQTQAIGQRREAESIVRIGDRIPTTGRHEVLDADGGVSQGGVKVYNAQEQYGDRVLAFPRLDGTIALDSEKGSVKRPPTAFPHCPGYLYGQVFNCEVPKKKKPGRVWILYAYQGRFYVGGHQQQPELIYDPIPPGSPVFQYSSYNQFSFQVRENYAAAFYGTVWGDGDGWEAKYSMRYPKKLCFANDSGIKSYDIFQRNNNYIYLGGWLGYGYFIGQYDWSRQGNNGGDAEVNFSDNWKNAIVDFEGFTTNTGRYSAVWSDSGNRITQSASGLEIYPSPYDLKIRVYERYFNESNGLVASPAPNYGYTRSTNPEILFRDRSSALFWSDSSDWSVGAFSSTRFGRRFSTILSGRSGIRETLLMELPSIDQRILESFRGKLFGIDRHNQMGGYDLRHYKYNNPSVTFVENVDNWRSLKTTNQNSEVTCSVRIYNINVKESLVDGQYTSVELNCWGVPFDAQIIDVAGWVP